MKNNTRWFIAAGLGVFVLSLFYLSKVYAFLTVAFVLAYLLDPVLEKLVKKGVRRDVGALFVLALFFLALTLGCVAIVPKLFAQAHELLVRLPRVYYGVSQWLTPWSERYLGYNVFGDVNKLVDSLGEPTALVAPVGVLLRGVFARTYQIVTTILGFLIVPLLAYYVLQSYPTLWKRFIYFVPNRHHKLAVQLRDQLNAVFGGFIRGQLVVSSILSVYYVTVFSILRLELGLVLGLMAGFFNVIPYVGIMSVLVLTFLIAVLHGASTAKFVGIAVTFAVGMAAEGSFLTPRIVGRKVGLGPLTLIIALLVGGELLGLVGMLLAVPIAAVAKVFLDVFVERYRNSEAFKRA